MTPAPPSLGYVPLWCKSHCSFLEGASAPEELVRHVIAALGEIDGSAA